MLMLAALVSGFIVAYVITPVIAQMLVRVEFIRPNYRQEMIPLGVGMVFVITYLIVSPFWIWWSLDLAPVIYISLSALFALTFLGLVDDALGSRSTTGLKGHLMKLVKEGELTTGALKALLGGVVALTVVASQFTGQLALPRLGLWLLQGIIIALSINSINLLDLRPGRAGKGFLLGAVVLIAVGWGKPELFTVMVVLGSLLAYLPRDLAARSMMGDTGANALGVTLGVTAVWVLPWVGQLALLAFLIGFHLFTERYSLTKVIEKNKVLNYLDMLGR